MSGEEPEVCTWKPSKAAKLARLTRGMDPTVWGKGGWSIQLMLAYAAALPEEDPEGVVAHAVHTAFLCEVMATPCGVCGTFYARHILALCSEPGLDPHEMRTQWFDVVAELKLMVEAKIGTGRGADTTILQWGGKQVEGLRKRVSASPPIMTWCEYTDALLLRAAWLERTAEGEKGMVKAFICLVTMLMAHARVLQPLLPQWSAALYATAMVGTNTLPGSASGKHPLFHAVWGMRKDMQYAAKMSMPLPLIAETEEEARTRLVGCAEQTLLGWYQEERLPGLGVF